VKVTVGEYVGDIETSPIFTNSLEIMEHAIEHLKTKSPRDMRLAVLHADNALELLLKELARLNGIRLIDKKGHSISYYDCVDKLEEKGIKIPGLPDIDILHDERNAIYHLGSQPDEKKTDWLVYKVALNLFNRICLDEFKYDITTFSKEFNLSSNIEHEIELTDSEITNRYQKDALKTFNDGAFNASIVFSYMAIEVFLREKIPLDLRQGPRQLQRLIKDDLISEEEMHEIVSLRNSRNLIVHGGYSPTREEAKAALEISRKTIGIIDSICK
jgi:uncharacterized protein YutE (UPF0331/DUF86 family)